MSHTTRTHTHSANNVVGISVIELNQITQFNDAQYTDLSNRRLLVHLPAPSHITQITKHDIQIILVTMDHRYIILLYELIGQV